MRRIASRRSITSTPSSPFYLSESRAYFSALNAAGYYPTLDQKLAHDTFVKELKSASLWTPAKIILPYKGGNATSAGVNAKSPGTGNATFEGTVFHKNWGSRSDGNGAPASQGGEIQLTGNQIFTSNTSGTILVYPSKIDNSYNGSGNSNTMDAGMSDGTNAFLLSVNTFGNSNAAQPSIGQCGPLAGRVTKTWASQSVQPFGAYTVIRGTGKVELWQGATLQVTGTTNLGTIPNVKPGVLCYSFNGLKQVAPRRGQMLCMMFERALTAGEMATLIPIVDKYVWAMNPAKIRLTGTSTYGVYAGTSYGRVRKQSSGNVEFLASGYFTDSLSAQASVDYVPFSGPYEIYGPHQLNYLINLTAGSTNLTNITIGDNVYLSDNVAIYDNKFVSLDFSNAKNLISLDVRDNTNLEQLVLASNSYIYETGEFGQPNPVYILISGTAITNDYTFFQNHFNQEAYGQYYGDGYSYGYNPYNFHRCMIGNYSDDITSTASENAWTMINISQELDSDAQFYIINAGNVAFAGAMSGNENKAFHTYFLDLKAAGIFPKIIELHATTQIGDLDSSLLALNGIDSATNTGLYLDTFGGYYADGTNGIYLYQNLSDYAGLGINNFSIFVQFMPYTNAFPGYSGDFVMYGCAASPPNDRFYSYNQYLSSASFRPRVVLGDQDNTPVTKAWDGYGESMVLVNSAGNLERAVYNGAGVLNYRDTFTAGGPVTGNLPAEVPFFLALNDGTNNPQFAYPIGTMNIWGVFQGLATYEQDALALANYTLNYNLGRA